MCEGPSRLDIPHCARFLYDSIAIQAKVSSLSCCLYLCLPAATIPLGKNFLTRTTTLTLPPGVGLETPSERLAETATPSLARRDGTEAVERNVAAEAEVDIAEGLVMPVIAEAPHDEEEMWEPGPVWWPRWW